MIANKWYCIAQSGTFDSGCIVDVSFDGYSIQFSVGIRYGSSSINITRCKLPSTINLSARLRQSDSQWSVDLLSDKEINPQVTVADSPFWVAVNTEAGAGNIVLSLTNISKEFNTETGSGSGEGFDEDMLRQFLKDNGYTALLDFWKWTEDAGGTLTTKYNIVVSGGGAFGKGSTSGGGGGTGGIGTVILRTPTDIEYTSDSNGVVNIPNWVTSERINGLASEAWVLQKNYLSKSAADELYAAKDDLDELKSMWFYDEDGNLHTTHNIVVEKGGAFGTGSSQGGGTSGLGNVTIYFEGSNIPYQTNEQGIITLPAYPTALKNPHALKINGVTYDGSKDITINLEGGGGIADSVAWENVMGRPTALSEFENDVPYLTEQKASDTYITKASLEDMWYIDDNGNLHTTYNIVVDGGGAFGKGSTSGGGGTSGWLGSVTIKTEGGNEYKSNSNGVVTVPNWITSAALNGYATQAWVEGKKYLTAIPSEYVTETELSNTLGGYQTKITSSNKLAYSLISGTPSSLPASDVYDWAKAATKPTYTASEVGALSTSGGAINGQLSVTGNFFAPNLWFNAGDDVGRILTAYSGLNYDLSYYDGATWERVLTSKNYSSYALPLSGGTLTGDLVLGWHSSAGSKSIAFTAESGGNKAYLYADAYDLKYLFNNVYNTIIHSGNIGSQSVYNASYVNGFGIFKVADIQLNTNGWYKIALSEREKIAIANFYSGLAWTAQDYGVSASFAGSLDTNGFISWGFDAPTVSFAGSNSLNCSNDTPNWYFSLSGTSGVAYDLNCAPSATKLATARTIWGQSFDGSGNVDGQFSLGGYLRMHSNSGELWLNYGGANNAYDLNVCGYVTRFYYGVASFYNSAMIINHTGNILIGTAEDRDGKLQINGKTRIYRAGDVSTYLDIAVADVNVIYNGVDNTDGYCLHTFKSNGTDIMLISGYDGSVSVYGNLIVTGGGAFGSDVRYKDILDYTNIDLATIANAPLFTYKWNDREDKKVYLGTTAQYWLDTNFRDAVNTSNPKFFHLDYGALGVGLAITTAREVVKVKTEVEQLRERVNELENELKQYRQWHN